MKDAVDFYCGDMNAATAAGHRDDIPGSWTVDGVEHSLLPGGPGEEGGGDDGQQQLIQQQHQQQQQQQQQQEMPPPPPQATVVKEGGNTMPAGMKPPSALVDGGKVRKEDKGYSDPQNAYFECNICLELAQDPVVTQCGHLYCWPCIYKYVSPGGEGWRVSVPHAAFSFFRNYDKLFQDATVFFFFFFFRCLLP